MGLFQPTPKEVQEHRRKMRKEEIVTVDLLHRPVPAKHTDEGLRALSGENPMRPKSVQKYQEGKFGDALEDVSNAMLELAKSLPPPQLAEKAYALYEKFRPEIPPGKKGWEASGKLDLDLIRKMASACPQGAFVLPYTRCDKQGRVRGPNLGFTKSLVEAIFENRGLRLERKPNAAIEGPETSKRSATCLRPPRIAC